MPLPPEVGTRLQRNLARVEHLIRLYAVAFPTGQGRRPVATSDILRASTVLLHASLEDFLRGVASHRLPGAGEDVLNDVPLVGLGASSRPEKFWLGALSAHRGKSVDTLIRESVEAHLAQANYNNTGDIAALLECCGIEPTAVNGAFPQVQELMERRHLIVHQADANPSHGRGQHETRSLGLPQVRRWLEAVEEFTSAVAAQIP